MTWNNIKSFLFQQRISKLSYKNGSIIAGVFAQILLVMGSVSIIDTPLKAIFDIGYAFSVLLPLSYYQMRMAERMGE